MAVPSFARRPARAAAARFALALPALALLAAMAGGGPAAAQPATPTVQEAGPVDAVRVGEVTMATPNIVAVELRDPPFRRGGIVALDAPRTEPNGTWVRRGNDWGIVVGPKRDHLRIADTPPTTFLDRDAVDDAAGYGPIGGRKVVAVHRKSVPFESGLFRGPWGGTRAGAGFRHEVFLELDGPLPPGAHVIAWPKRILPETAFTFDDRATCAMAIRATQNGHRPEDVAKVAYLAFWLPGGPDGGAVDFRRYGLDTFRILDAGGQEVFSGPIRLRMAPDAPEFGNGLPKPLVDYVDAAAQPVGLSRLSGNRFTAAAPHGLAKGQRIALQRLGGEMDATAVFATVAAVNGREFEVAELSGGLPAQLAAGASVTRARAANRAQTHVFELDYSAFRPTAQGNYRIHIPGLGVSDPILFDETVWTRAAGLSLAGLYHHRSGIALDGRFGYTRPAPFRPGAGVTVRESRLPLAWSSNFEWGFIPFPEAVTSAWITDKVAPDTYWGGYMDAGDWDRRIHGVEVTSLLLDAFEATPPARRAQTFGLPRTRELLDHPAYAGTDDLPDVLHEAIWSLDFFRRLQVPDGSVRGGIESDEHPMKGEPSFLEHRQVFTYAPDHMTSYHYASVAAKLSRLLAAAGQPAAARLYADSAAAAFKAAERGYADPDAYYADALKAAAAAGTFKAEPWATRKAVLQKAARGYRGAAAAGLFRLTGDKAYGRLFEDEYRAGWDLYARKGDAAWDYMNAAGADPAIVAALGRQFQHDAREIVDAQDKVAYPGLKHPYAPSGWGHGAAPAVHELQLVMRAHMLSGDQKLLEAMHRVHHLVYGANQLGRTLVTGGGLRQATNPLHEDSIAMGVPAPAGITIYGWAPQAETAFGWLFGPPWSPMPETGVAEQAAQRRIEPSRFALPFYEYLVEHPGLVMQQEYTVQQTIGTMAALALYLNAR